MVRFLQLQHRGVEKDIGDGDFEPVDELVGGRRDPGCAGTRRWSARYRSGHCDIESALPQTLPIEIAAGTDVEAVDGGRLVRTRRRCTGRTDDRRRTRRRLRPADVAVRNIGAAAADKDEAIAVSLIGTHCIAEVAGGEFVSLLEPPDPTPTGCRPMPPAPLLPGARRPARRPRDLLLVSPIILYDHPEIAEQSDGRAVRLHRDRRDPHAAGDDDDRRGEGAGPGHRPAGRRRSSTAATRCRRRHAAAARRAARSARRARRRPGLIPEIPDGVDWWDPWPTTRYDPDIDAVLVNGVPGQPGQPGPAAAAPARRRAGHVLRRPDRPGHLGARGRRRRPARRRGASRTIRPPTCTSGTAATCTSRPTRSNR